MSTFVSQLPPLSPGQLETWLLCAVAVAGAVALSMKLFVRRPSLEAEFVTKEEFRSFRASVEQDLNGLRDRIDSRHVAVIQSLEQVKGALLADGERRAAALHVRLNEMEAGLARVDERTRAK
jgi:hypothetical protein